MDSINDMDTAIAEKAALVALLRQPKVRWSEVAAEILEHGSAVASFQSHFGGDGALFPRSDMEEAIAYAAAEIGAWEANGIGVNAFHETSYPDQLRDIHQMPPILFTKGILREEDRRAVAVVGTRRPSDRGLNLAYEVATALVKNDVTVVSGLATGIDTAAHRAALEAKGRTVAVLGTGILRTYPASNTALQEQIAREGLLISQFWPDGSPSKKTFPMRNAVMSGYAAATIVIEAAWQSGARIQARLALQHGRPVVMPRGLLTHDWAREYASRPGVYVVSNQDELLSVVDKLVDEAAVGLRQLRELASLVEL